MGEFRSPKVYSSLLSDLWDSPDSLVYSVLCVVSLPSTSTGTMEFGRGGLFGDTACIDSKGILVLLLLLLLLLL